MKTQAVSTEKATPTAKKAALLDTKNAKSTGAVKQAIDRVFTRHASAFEKLA